jgi:hypothetical protein
MEGYVLALLEKYSKREDRTISYLVNKYLRLYMEELENKLKKQ